MATDALVLSIPRSSAVFTVQDTQVHVFPWSRFIQETIWQIRPICVQLYTHILISFVIYILLAGTNQCGCWAWHAFDPSNLFPLDDSGGRGSNLRNSYQIRKIAGSCAGNAGNVFPAIEFKPLVSVTHVPWCMSGSLTRGGGENVPGILGACTTRNFTYQAKGP